MEQDEEKEKNDNSKSMGNVRFQKSSIVASKKRLLRGKKGKTIAQFPRDGVSYFFCGKNH